MCTMIGADEVGLKAFEDAGIGSGMGIGVADTEVASRAAAERRSVIACMLCIVACLQS